MRYLLLILSTLLYATAASAQTTPITVKGTYTLTADTTDIPPTTPPLAPAPICGVAYVQFYLGTTPLGPRITTPTAGTTRYTYAWDTTKTANGTYTVSAKSVDKAGGLDLCNGTLARTGDKDVTTGQLAAATFTVANISEDVTPPTIKLILPAVAEIVDHFAPIRVAADDPSGVSRIQLFFNESPGPYWPNQSDITLDWNTRPWKGQDVTIRAEATDASNNKNKGSQTATVKVQ